MINVILAIEWEGDMDLERVTEIFVQQLTILSKF